MAGTVFVDQISSRIHFHQRSLYRRDAVRRIARPGAQSVRNRYGGEPIPSPRR